MPRYRMRVYKTSDQLWQTHSIYAPNDQAAKRLAREKFDELGTELLQQTDPKIDDPKLERFGLYDGDRLVSEYVSKGSH